MTVLWPMWGAAALVDCLPITGWGRKGAVVGKILKLVEMSSPLPVDLPLSTNKQNQGPSPSLLQTGGVNDLGPPEKCSQNKVSLGLWAT